MVQDWEQRRRGSISVGAKRPHIIGAGTGILLPVGLWTPRRGSARYRGVLVTIVELWIVLSCVGDPLVLLTLAKLSSVPLWQ